MQTFKKLLFLLTPSECIRAGLIVILITITALIDIIGVASILPFMQVLMNPSHVETNMILNTLFQFSITLGVENKQDFLIFLGFFFFLILVVSFIFKIFLTYVQVRFVKMREYSIGKRLIEKYLHQPYSWFLFRNSADIGKNILSEIVLLLQIFKMYMENNYYLMKYYGDVKRHLVMV